MEDLEQRVRERALRWTQPPFDDETRAEVEALLADGGEALVDAFYTDLEFGTGGLRGLMGPGTTWASGTSEPERQDAVNRSVHGRSVAALWFRYQGKTDRLGEG